MAKKNLINGMAEGILDISCCPKMVLNDKRHKSSIMRIILFAVAFITALLVILTIYISPYSFAYTDTPAKSNAVIFFMGSKDRNKEARLLLNKGYAR